MITCAAVPALHHHRRVTAPTRRSARPCRSPGIQEEAPSFGVPVLVLRDATERQEAVEYGWAQLVGTDPVQIAEAAGQVLRGADVLPTTGNPFGDGRAASRSAAAIHWLLGLGSRPEDFIAVGPVGAAAGCYQSATRQPRPT